MRRTWGWELPSRTETEGGSHREKMGRLGKGSDMGKLEGSGGDLEEGKAGKSALFSQWTNKAVPPSITITHLWHPDPTLAKGLGVVTAAPTPPFKVPGSRSGIPNLHLHIYTPNMIYWQEQSHKNGICQIWQKRPTRKAKQRAPLPPSKQEAISLLDFSCCLVHQSWGPECSPKTKEAWKCHLQPSRDQDSLSFQSTHISWMEGSIPLVVLTPDHWAISNVRPTNQTTAAQ